MTSSVIAADQDWFWRAPTAGTQLHNMTISYTWDVPDGSKLWDNALTRGALDGWQLSGNTAFVSGDWAGVSFSTTDNFDFYGGGGAGGRIVLTGVDPRSGDNLDPNPDGTGRYLNPAAFARPSGRLDLGNAPARFFRLPWIKNTDLSMFKNFQLGGGRRVQIRWEVYNLLNTVNWSGIGTTLQFDAAGVPVISETSTFGKATSGTRPAHHAGRDPVQLLDPRRLDPAGACRPGRVRIARRQRVPTMKAWRPTAARSLRLPGPAPVVVLCVAALLLVSRSPAVSAAAGPAPSWTQTNRTLHVTVVTDKGAAVPDLTSADFEVKEEGRTRQVIEAAPATRPLALALILNDKGSDINEIRAGFAAFLARVQGHAEVSLTRTALTALRVFDSTSSGPAMMAGLQRLVWRSGPNGGLLLGVVADAADELGRREGARPAIVVVHFEGDEYRSPRSGASVLASLERSHVALHVIAVGTPTLRRMGRAPTEDVQGDEWIVDDQNRNAVLGEGPKQSGGRRHELTAATGLTRALESVADDLLHQYTVVYAGAADTRPSSKLSVSVKRRGVTIRAPTRIAG